MTYQRLKSLPHHSATFIEPMECLAATKIPDDRDWVYEIKLDACEFGHFTECRVGNAGDVLPQLISC